MKEFKGIIYKATCLIDGFGYVGQTLQILEKRIKQHNKKRLNPKQYFHCALKKHGMEMFTWEIVDSSAKNQEELDILEDKYISLFGTLFPNGYNLTTGGKKSKFVDDVKERMSESQKIKVFTEDHRKSLSISATGRILSEEIKEKISKANKGRRLSEEHKKKLLIANSRPHSEETKRKISIAHKGKTISEEQKRKLADSHRGKTPWNKGKKGLQVAWNKGLKKSPL